MQKVFFYFMQTDSYMELIMKTWPTSIEKKKIIQLYPYLFAVFSLTTDAY